MRIKLFFIGITSLLAFVGCSKQKIFEGSYDATYRIWDNNNVIQGEAGNTLYDGVLTITKQGNGITGLLLIEGVEGSFVSNGGPDKVTYNIAPCSECWKDSRVSSDFLPTYEGTITTNDGRVDVDITSEYLGKEIILSIDGE